MIQLNEEITEEVLKLKIGKEAGPDGKMNTCFKLAFQQFQRYVNYIFNLCFAEHIVTRFWNSDIRNHFTKAKGAKQNKVPTEALACYVACAS